MGVTGTLQRGANAVTPTDWFELVVVLVLIAVVGVMAASEVAITRTDSIGTAN